MNKPLHFLFSLFLVYRVVCGGSSEAYKELGSGSADGERAISLASPGLCGRSVIRYVSFFPCTDVELSAARNNSVAALRLLRSCDVFAYIAAKLAVRHVNQHLQGIFTYPDRSLLPDATLELLSGQGTQVSPINHQKSYIFYSILFPTFSPISHTLLFILREH